MSETGRPAQMVTAIFPALSGCAADFKPKARRGEAGAYTPKASLTWRLGVLSVAV